MQTLQLDKNKARSLYPSASAEFKTMLEDTFGKEFFSQKITDRVKTLNDACEVLGLNPSCVISSSDSKDEIAYKKLKVIIRALNEGWTPDWSNSNEYKYYPWFKMQGGFVLYYVDYNFAATDVGSRLCFKNEDLALYAVKQFSDLYKDYFTI